MVVLTPTFIQSLVLGLATLSLAHPGHHEEASASKLEAKRNFVSKSSRSLAACSEQLERRGVYSRAQARRKAKAASLSKRSEPGKLPGSKNDRTHLLTILKAPT
jgi:hypothetical protein